MKKKLIKIGSVSKGLILPLDIFKDIDSVNTELDTINKKITITWE